MSKYIKYLIGCFALLALQMTQSAVALLPVKIDVHDQTKLQRGAKIFMNYCSGCHSLQYLRYSRMGKDLGLVTFNGQLDTRLLINNLVFTHAKVQDPIQVSMPVADARQWFGLVPPDLSLTARERGAAWIYTYLKSFYADSARPFGTNNLLVLDTAMPNILAPLEGEVIARTESSWQIPRLVLKQKGEMSPQQFDEMLEDLVTFLVYVAEPAKLVRYSIGIKVIIFLLIFLVVAYLLKRSYWKKV
ncbi:cytochrome c1 [Legionella maceachernii]|uniref:Ubiquinol-cytochrome c reductase cytochrome c1 subunit n=2 Tax=Legionella maceachernii TaxID=466 RepID=A0A0W0W049_9GAMM|nr:cytochrome c1 [Legionella maceachernii]KTD25534.1 ubiquinol-cytochrome c reductase cytochrome c1 subunit [Legionella maceachernii]SJZ55584.1 ubiquinol-cytochrome c reductase cytochrome c1 subunit [Legionella maceachernii]SUP00439.1 Cytochrome b/c1 [Legionella maceachernii]